MPKLVKLYITQVFIGFGVAAAFVAGLLYFNVVNMWHLVSHSDIGWLAVLILWFANGIVFSGVQFGITVMRMAEAEGGDTGGKRDDLPVGLLEPVRVEQGERR
ncbi:hypothetical protein [Celeribacter indicus]|uniref:Uncharacterized protein n=1 Tax=Celeribacter indicus TaxID=1208324 RepID=A0A0B5E6Q2_9RHOB|nr:hypothetical protein [Celeribacter indicus]AJE48012.1 hypothetical protein P73_3297 [Celeribacter indicus]SDW29450.1 hypothetical protein SAMN05443573_102290 [Celeribacter indicus]